MIANISSAVSNFEETLNTLKYANRAKNIKTSVTRNELNVSHHISEYVNLITDLRSEINKLKLQVRGSESRGHELKKCVTRRLSRILLQTPKIPGYSHQPVMLCLPKQAAMA